MITAAYLKRDVVRNANALPQVLTAAAYDLSVQSGMLVARRKADGVIRSVALAEVSYCDGFPGAVAPAKGGKAGG